VLQVVYFRVALTVMLDLEETTKCSFSIFGCQGFEKNSLLCFSLRLISIRSCMLTFVFFVFVYVWCALNKLLAEVSTHSFVREKKNLERMHFYFTRFRFTYFLNFDPKPWLETFFRKLSLWKNKAKSKKWNSWNWRNTSKINHFINIERALYLTWPGMSAVCIQTRINNQEIRSEKLTITKIRLSLNKKKYCFICKAKLFFRILVIYY
jgi:hypothetical protein